MQNQDKFKKILIIMVVLSLFGVSYYYYGAKNKKSAPELAQKSKAVQPEAAVKNAVNKPDEAKTVKKEEPKKEELKKVGLKKKVAPKKEVIAVVPQEKKIQPTNKAKMLRLAAGTKGKFDPFSYSESRFMPFGTSGGHSSRLSGLPAPPSANGVSKPTGDYVEIRGFFGNKVIAEVNGYTDSLGIGETLHDVKVVSVSPENLSCVLLVKGKKVTKKVAPIVKKDKNVEINYIKETEAKASPIFKPLIIENN